MRAVIQRVECASVSVEGRTVGEIEGGAAVFLGVLIGDNPNDAERLAFKIAHFRFFEDEEGRMGRSILDLVESGARRDLLVVSQFTLAADGKKGRRPSFDRAAPPAEAEPLYEHFCATLRGFGLGVETGTFGAKMTVSLDNDGPVTFVLDESQSTP